MITFSSSWDCAQRTYHTRVFASPLLTRLLGPEFRFKIFGLTVTPARYGRIILSRRICFRELTLPKRAVSDHYELSGFRNPPDLWKGSELGCAAVEMGPDSADEPVSTGKRTRHAARRTLYNQEASAVFSEWAPDNLWKEFQFKEVC